MKKSVRKAVFPVAGLGTRLLPATKSIPKEMFPVVDRPVIELVVEEARKAGIEQFIFVTSRNKGVIEDHFDRHFELESALRAKDDESGLSRLGAGEATAGSAVFTRQPEALGLGHAVWCARHAVGDEPFALLLPDMVMDAEPGCLAQMIDVYKSGNAGNVVAVEERPSDELHHYGVVGASEWKGDSFMIDSMVEKPGPGAAPSNFIISGRYILQPAIFGELQIQVDSAAGREVQLTDAMIRLLGREPFKGLRYRGKTYDCGSKLGFLLANVAFGLKHEETGPALRSELVKMLAS